MQSFSVDCPRAMWRPCPGPWEVKPFLSWTTRRNSSCDRVSVMLAGQKIRRRQCATPFDAMARPHTAGLTTARHPAQRDPGHSAEPERPVSERCFRSALSHGRRDIIEERRPFDVRSGGPKAGKNASMEIPALHLQRIDMKITDLSRAGYCPEFGITARAGPTEQPASACRAGRAHRRAQIRRRGRSVA